MTMQDAKDRAKLEAEAQRLGITPSALEMSRAVGTDLIRDIVRDNRKSYLTRPSGDAQSSQPANRNGWVDPPQVRDWRPPGLAAMDRMMDVQDSIDRTQRARQLADAKRGDGQ
jgi:hypothetical protein